MVLVPASFVYLTPPLAHSEICKNAETPSNLEQTIAPFQDTTVMSVMGSPC